MTRRVLWLAIAALVALIVLAPFVHAQTSYGTPGNPTQPTESVQGIGGMTPLQTTPAPALLPVPTLRPGQNVPPPPYGVRPSYRCPLVATFNTTSSARVIQNAGGMYIDVCAWDVVLGGAESASLVEGTGTNCGTGTAGLDGQSGGTLPFAANGGKDSGGSSEAVRWPMQTRGDDVCVAISAANAASGSINYGLYR